MERFLTKIKAITRVLLVVVTTVLPTFAVGQQVNEPYFTDCTMRDWAAFLDPDQQKVKPVEQIVHPDGMIKVFRLSPLKGKFAKLYVFLLDNGRCYPKVFSVGSYAWHAQENTDSSRVYHADLYEPGAHSTITYFDHKPRYKEVRALAIKVLQ